MTIPAPAAAASRNWCPTCQEVCHDHDSICTICGDRLVDSPQPQHDETNPHQQQHPISRNSLLVSSRDILMGHFHDVGSSDLRLLLEQLQHRIDDIDHEQSELMDRARSLVRILDPQQQNNAASSNHSRRPTAQAVLDAIPRIQLTKHSAIFQQCSLQLMRKDDNTENSADNNLTTAAASVAVISSLEQPVIPAIPAEFGRTSFDQPIRWTHCRIVIADPITAPGYLSQSTHQQIQQQYGKHDGSSSSSCRSRVLLCTMRGGNTTFIQKAQVAAAAGASALIVINHLKEPWPYIMKDSTGQARNMKNGVAAVSWESFPVVMISQAHGKELLRKQQPQTDPPKEDKPNSPAPVESLEWILSMQKETAFPECAVCTETFQPGACIVELPQCRHTFHETCALTWLQSHNTCPYCRHELPHGNV
jgi:hypothetical protein